jgi:hypothetical protein
VNVPPLARRCGAALLLVALSGCATSLVSGGAVREAPYRAIVTRAVAVRGLPLDRPVPARVVPPDAVPGLLREVIESGLTAQEVADYQDALVAIGLWPEERNVVEEYLAVAGEEVLGFYVPRDRTLYVVSDPSMPLSMRVSSLLMGRDLARELVLGHEVIHALQHQSYPDLMEHDRFLKDHDDVGTALQAALEGDATWYGFAVLDPPLPPPDPPDFRADLERDTAERTDGALAATPALIREGLYFPYARGYALAYAEGDGLLEHPPVSTEQVLHPDRRDAPFTAIDLAPARALLPDGCSFVHENEVGEFALGLLLHELSGPGETSAPSVPDGWDGDRYLVARCGGTREFLWITTWDGEDDAREFEQAYRAVAEAVRGRGGLAAAPDVTRRGSEVWIATPALVPVRERMAAAARRGRVSTLAQLLAFWGEPAQARPR